MRLHYAKYPKIYFDKVRRKYSIKSPISLITHRAQPFYVLFTKLHSVKVRQRRKPYFIKVNQGKSCPDLKSIQIVFVLRRIYGKCSLCQLHQGI